MNVKFPKSYLSKNSDLLCKYSQLIVSWTINTLLASLHHEDFMILLNRRRNESIYPKRDNWTTDDSRISSTYGRCYHSLEAETAHFRSDQWLNIVSHFIKSTWNRVWEVILFYISLNERRTESWKETFIWRTSRKIRGKICWKEFSRFYLWA